VVIEVQKRKVERLGYARRGWADGKDRLTTEQWCIIECGKVIAEARSRDLALRIRAALMAARGTAASGDLVNPPVYDEPTGEARKSAESASKPRLELLPGAALEQIAEVLTYGAAKYEAHNWCRGARWGRYFAALLRHLFAWWRGEDLDPETGMSHLAHAGCCLLFLMEYQRNGWGADDRFRGPDGEAFKKNDGATADD